MPRGRPKGSRNSSTKGRSKSAQKRADTKRCNKCGSLDHIRSTKLQCPKYFDPVPSTAEKGTKKRGRPKGSKNKSKKGFGGSTSERLDRAFMIDDMFYSSVLTEEARSTFLEKYPGEESFFTVEWGRVAGEVADAIAGKYRSVFSIDDDDA